MGSKTSILLYEFCQIQIGNSQLHGAFWDQKCEKYAFRTPRGLKALIKPYKRHVKPYKALQKPLHLTPQVTGLTALNSLILNIKLMGKFLRLQHKKKITFAGNTQKKTAWLDLHITPKVVCF